MAKTDTANNYVPKDYEDLYRYYILGDGLGNSLCHKIIRSMMPHATDDERETLAQDVAERLIKKNMLKVFDPAKANFGGVIFFTTRSIVVNHLSQKGRNPIAGLRGGSLTITTPDEDEFEPGTYSLDRLFTTDAPDHGSAIDAEHLTRKLGEWAFSLFQAPAHKRDASLYPLLGLLTEGHDAKECGAKLGVTASTVWNWIEILRAKLGELQAELE